MNIMASSVTRFSSTITYSKCAGMVDRLHLGCSVNYDVEVRLLLLVFVFVLYKSLACAARLTVDHPTSDGLIFVRFECSAIPYAAYYRRKSVIASVV